MRFGESGIQHDFVPCQVKISAQKWDPALSRDSAVKSSTLYDGVVTSDFRRTELGPRTTEYLIQDTALTRYIPRLYNR